MVAKTVFGFEKRDGIPMVVEHTFEPARDGQLLHFINGQLRATVPPEGWRDYCETYPEAQDVVDSLTRIPSPPSGDTGGGAQT